VGPVAYAHSIDDGTLTAKDGSKTHLVVRATDVLRKSNGKWHIVQEHNSVPVDPATGKADLLSRP
jgi:ketosteroid isomerase-like protein